MDLIGSSSLTWQNPNGIGDRSGNSFVNTGTFTGLPANNSDFGPKNIRLRVTGVSAFNVDRQINVFYPADGANWPGAPENRAAKNYFHYYLQTPAGGGYTPEWDGFSPFLGTYRYQWFAAASSGDRTNGKLIPCPGVNGRQRLSYIDGFAWSVRHERETVELK